MGNLLKTKKLTTGAEWGIVIIGLLIVGFGVYFFAPGLRVSEAKTLSGLEINSDNINNVTKGEMLAAPTEVVSTQVAKLPLNRIAEYAWNANSDMIAANGGPRTTEGSLMEAAGVNLEIVRKDMVGDLRNMQLNFIAELDKGTEYPTNENSAFAISVMGDGVPFYLATTQKAINDKFGEGKYHVKVIAPIGLSYGEDKVIGPAEWKTNPKSMIGALISTVVGDGDHILALNFCFANALKVNPDVTTYDATAVNFTPSEGDDFTNAAKELIKSQKSGFTIPLKEVVNGKLTGKTIDKKIDGCSTWTPADKVVFDALNGFTDVVSTKDFPNQMATTVIVVDEFATKHDKLVTAMLKATYVAANQIKQYDQWAVKASEAVCKTYGMETPKYWYDMFKGVKGSNGGVDFSVGGSRVMNYADAMQYYGITDGTNRYKAVYNQIGTYLTELNPCDFNGTCKNGPIPFEDAVNMYFLKNINDIDAGVSKKADYTVNKTEVMASGEWHINFGSGSTAIEGSTKDLETIYNLLIAAEDTKLKIIGHTDNTGNSDANKTLSKGRANSVVTYLTNKGIPASRFQTVDGAGDTDPIADNKTAAGKAKNRRVVITLLK